MNKKITNITLIIASLLIVGVILIFCFVCKHENNEEPQRFENTTEQTTTDEKKQDNESEVSESDNKTTNAEKTEEKGPPTEVQTQAKPKTDTEEDEPQKWALILVNKKHRVPADLSIKTVSIKGIPVDVRIAPYVNQIIDAAKKEGVNLGICSGYRTIARQQQLYDKEVQRWVKRGMELEQAQNEASRHVAMPGTSEHNSGLAIDFSSNSDKGADLEERFEDTAEGKFLKRRASDFGFIVRYEKGKESITGVVYEPWHLRYVGSIAKEITELGLCYEEYYERSVIEQTNKYNENGNTILRSSN